MPSRNSWFVRPVLGFAVLFVALSLSVRTRGQEQGDNLPGNDMDTVTKAYEKHRNLLAKLLRGQDAYDAKNPAHAEALDAGAKYMTYRYTWATIQSTFKKIEDAHLDFEKQIPEIKSNKANQQEVALAYTKAVAQRGREVINTSKPIARVNAAMVLAKLAELGQGELADTLLDVFTKELTRDDKSSPKRNDGVKYYMLAGMRNLLATPNSPPPAPPVLSPERSRKLAETLLAFVNKPQAFPKDTPLDEIEGYRSLRREALRGLVYCTAPGMKDKERPGMTLLRVMARDGLKPEPRIDECLEGAIGVARMRAPLDGDIYQPEYAAYQIALFVDAFGTYYMANKAQEPRPYKTYAARLIEALEAMKTDTKNPYVGEVFDQCINVVLSPMEKGQDVRTLNLTQFLQRKPPPKEKEGLFSGIADSIVKPANRPPDMQ